MQLPRNSRLTSNSRKLRNGMTKQEIVLWNGLLRKLPLTVNRQKVIGPYIIDFYCHNAKVAIEVDGGQHYEESGLASDSIRENYLNNLGIEVIRFTNYEVDYQFEQVCIEILEKINIKTGLSLSTSDIE
jgi:very-short-patch-repair endonuclease